MSSQDFYPLIYRTWSTLHTILKAGLFSAFISNATLVTMSASKPKPELSVRSANEQDLPALTTLTISSFVTDPQWSYRLSYRDQFPEDHFKYSMDRLDGFLSQVPRGCAAYMVAEAEESAGKRIVGAATWQLPGSHLEGENRKLGHP